MMMSRILAARRARSARRGAHPLRTSGIVGCVALLLMLLAACGAPQEGRWDQMTLAADQVTLALAAAPGSPGLIYAGGSGGTVYRALADRTQSPVAGTGIPSSAVVASLAADPQKTALLYAGTSDGLYVSTHYGDTWSRARNAGLPGGDTIAALILLPTGHTLLAGTTAHGLYASADAGATWQLATSGLPADASVVALMWDDAAHIAYAAVAHAGLFASANGGATWRPSGPGLPNDVYSLTHEAVGGQSASAPTLFAATSTGVFAASDPHTGWQRIGAGLPNGAVYSVAADSHAAGSLYAGTRDTVYHSADGGRTWALLAPGLNNRVTQLLVAPGAGGQPVVFAAAGNLFRYPPPPSATASPVSIFLNILFFVLFVAGAGYLLLRARRQIRALDRRLVRPSMASDERQAAETSTVNAPSSSASSSGSGALHRTAPLRRPAARKRGAPPAVRGYGGVPDAPITPGDDPHGRPGVNGHGPRAGGDS